MSADWLTQGIYAHRGWHGDGRVENSPSAFHAAIEAGIGIECDVQQTADGQAMVFHDWDLDRLTGERGPLIARTAEELSRIPLNGGDPIWTLPELLAEIAGRVPLLIEIKSWRDRAPVVPLCEAVLDAVAGYRDKAAVMSFDPRVPLWFSGQAPSIARGLVVNHRNNPLWSRVAMWTSNSQFLAYDVRDLPSRFAARQRARGMPVLTWTVSDKARLQTARAFADAPIAEGEGLEEALRTP